MKNFIVTIVAFSLPVFFASSNSCLAKDSNFLLPVTELERRYQFDDFDVFKSEDLRENGSVKRTILKWSDGTYTRAKWKPAPRGGHVTNNAPRYEIAAYRLQQLFLDTNEYVVPPTVMRTLPLQQYRQLQTSRRRIEPTFENTESVCVVLQYWLENVSPDNIYDKKRFKTDTTYARCLANMNILSYLIRHVDSNIGNFLISKDPDCPRVFMVDNGMAFASRDGERGRDWHDLRIKCVPGKTLERLRNINLETLHEMLGVVVQYEVKEGLLKQVEASGNINPKLGVRVSEQIIQFGLTKKEIEDIYKRQQKLLKIIAEGNIQTF